MNTILRNTIRWNRERAGEADNAAKHCLHKLRERLTHEQRSFYEENLAEARRNATRFRRNIASLEQRP